MNAAQDLIQQRGYNAFSYKDLASEVGIRTASIHYHYPAKGDLGLAVMERYLEGLEASLANLDARRRTAKGKLKGFIALYAETEACGGICLCGSLASDRETLPTELADAVGAYIERCEAWIAKVLRAGIADGEFRDVAQPAGLASLLLAGLQGTLILARGQAAQHGPGSIQTLQRTFLESLQPA